VGWFKRHLDTVIAPLGLAGVYAFFIYASEAGPLPEALAGFFFVALITMWYWVRRLRVHAAASRLAAIGRPDELLALCEREAPLRKTHGTRAPVYVFEAMAHNMLGDFAAARGALDKAGIVPGGKTMRAWQFMWAAADIHARTGLGDVAGAKKTYAAAIAPMRTFASGGVELVAIEAEARIKLAEGDAVGARDLVAPIVKDMRLGSGARGQLHALLAQAAAKAGDADAAATHRAEAKKLAPRCVVPDAAAAA
jgi:hypothetical protein